MRPPGTPSDKAEPAGAAASDDGRIASELALIERDLTSGLVPDAELLRRIEAFADLFLTPDEREAD